MYLRARWQISRRALALLKTVDSGVLQAELERRKIGSHVFNTTVRPLHALRAQLLDAALLKLGIDMAADDLTPGPPRKAYESFARPREGEPCGEEYVTKKAPLIAQQVAFLHRHELARRNELLRNVDDAEKAMVNAHKPRHNVTLVLDNLRSAENVGSIFRTADAARACIVTCGFTTTPPDRKLQKTALGAITSVPCTHYEGTLAAVRALRDRGMYVVALETTEDALPMGTAPQLGDEARGVAVVLGNEVTGVDKAVLDACDAVVEIPVFGIKNSLNVSVCASIILYEVLRRWGKYEAEPPKAG